MTTQATEIRHHGRLIEHFASEKEATDWIAAKLHAHRLVCSRQEEYDAFDPEAYEVGPRLDVELLRNGVLIDTFDDEREAMEARDFYATLALARMLRIQLPDIPPRGALVDEKEAERVRAELVELRELVDARLPREQKPFKLIADGVLLGEYADKESAEAARDADIAEKATFARNFAERENAPKRQVYEEQKRTAAAFNAKLGPRDPRVVVEVPDYVEVPATAKASDYRIVDDATNPRDALGFEIRSSSVKTPRNGPPRR